MQFAGLLYVTALIFVGITSILCEQNYIEYSKYNGKNPTTETTNISNEVDSFNAKTPKYDRLSSLDFTFAISAILTPDIFTNENPLQFLINKMNTIRVNPEWTIAELSVFLKGNKFPPHYVPYAKALVSLLRIRSELDSLQWSINCIRRSWSTPPNGYFPLPDQFSKQQLPKLFSYDVFSDPKPPFRILNEILNLPEDEIIKVVMQLINLSQYDRLPRHYPSYIKTLLDLLRNGYLLQSVKTDFNEIQHAAPNASSSDQSSNI